jgi:hypothetical protein
MLFLHYGWMNSTRRDARGRVSPRAHRARFRQRRDIGMGGVQRFAFFKTSKRLDRALIILLAISVVFGFYGLATGSLTI